MSGKTDPKEQAAGEILFQLELAAAEITGFTRGLRRAINTMREYGVTLPPTASGFPNKDQNHA